MSKVVDTANVPVVEPVHDVQEGSSSLSSSKSNLDNSTEIPKHNSTEAQTNNVAAPSSPQTPVKVAPPSNLKAKIMKVMQMPIVTFVVGITVTFLFGWFGFSLLWIPLFIGIFVSWSSITNKKLIAQRLAEEKELSNEPLPETETVSWLNRIIKIAFENHGKFLTTMLLEKVNPVLAKNKIAIVHVSLGDKTPQIYDVCVNRGQESDEMVFDLSVKFISNLQIVLNVAAGPIPMSILASDLVFDGRLRVWIKFHSNKFPFVQLVKFKLLEDPKNLDIAVRPLQAMPDVMSLPVLCTAIHSMITDQLRERLVKRWIIINVLEIITSVPAELSELEKKDAKVSLGKKSLDELTNIAAAPFKIGGAVVSGVGGAMVTGGAAVVGGVGTAGSAFVGGTTAVGGAAVDATGHVVGGAVDVGNFVVGGSVGGVKKMGKGMGKGFKKGLDVASLGKMGSSKDKKRDSKYNSLDKSAEKSGNNSSRSENRDSKKRRSRSGTASESDKSVSSDNSITPRSAEANDDIEEDPNVVEGALKRSLRAGGVIAGTVGLSKKEKRKSVKMEKAKLKHEADQKKREEQDLKKEAKKDKKEKKDKKDNGHPDGEKKKKLLGIWARNSTTKIPQAEHS